MNKDIIYREDAMKEIEEYIVKENEAISEHPDDIFKYNSGLLTAIQAVHDLPSADRPQDDTVSRRYLLAEIDDLADEFSEVNENGLHSERWCGIVDAKCVIVNAPSVPDRPQGEWVNRHKWPNGFFERECSVCGAMKPSLRHTAKINFCPNCGTSMRGEYDE